MASIPQPSAVAVSTTRRKRKVAGLSRRQQREFSNYQQSISQRIPDILHTALPTQILRLHHLVQSIPPYTPAPLTPPTDPPLTPYTTPDTSHLDKADPASYAWRRKPDRPPSAFHHPAHPQLAALLPSFRPTLFALYGLLTQLSHRLLLSLPGLDDTSNASLAMPQTALQAIRRASQHLLPHLHASQYHSQRALLLERAAKYGWEANLVAAVAEWDEREWGRLRGGMRECLGRLLMLWDLLRKNADIWTLEQSAFDIQRT